MFTINGIVYANKLDDTIQVTFAKPLEDMMILITFSSGETRLFDATILKGSAFQPLSNEAIFNNCKVVDGTVTWMNEEIDCSPEYMYKNSYAYPEYKAI